MNLALSALLAAATTAAAQDPAPKLAFTEVAAAAGIDVTNMSGEPDKPRILDALGCGLAWFDYDGDGWLDLFVPNGATLATVRGAGDPVPSDRLFRNRGDGTFEDVGMKAGIGDRAWGSGAAAGDFDNDGDRDLYVCNLGRNRLWRNEGDGTFVDIAEAAGVGCDGITPGAAWGDIDLDGDLDLYVSAYIAFDFARPSAPFAKTMRGMKVMSGPRGLRGAADRLFRNEGSGRFVDATVALGLDPAEEAKGFTIQIVDLDLDDRPDIFVANDMTPSHHLAQLEDGKFESIGETSGLAYDRYGAELACMGVAISDQNDDLIPDLFITTFAHEKNEMFWSLPDCYWDEDSDMFAEPAGPPLIGWGAGFFDFDRDGDEDLAVFNGHVQPQVDGEKDGEHAYAQRPLLYRCDGRRRFTDVAVDAGDDFFRPRCARGAAFADYDEDGDVDIALSVIDGKLELLRNDTAASGHWLRVAVQGSRCNRDGYGARVTIEAGSRRATRWVLGQGSYVSQNDARAHFGLGAATRVDRVTVRWPGGIEEVLPGPFECDKTLLVREGAGVVAEARRGAPVLFPVVSERR